MKLYSVLWFAALITCLCNGCLSLSKIGGGVLPVFASYRIAITHCVVAIPIAYLFASQIQRRWPAHRYTFILAAVYTLFFPQALETISWTLKRIESGFLIWCSVRCILAISLVSSWIATYPNPIVAAPKRSWIWTIVLCCAFPSIYAWKQRENYRDEFESSLAGMRISKAFIAIERFIEIGGPDNENGVASSEQRRNLLKEIANSEQVVATPIFMNSSIDVRLQRAMQLLSLSRNSEAEQVLLEARSRDPQIVLLLAIAARERSDNATVEALCRELLAGKSDNGLSKPMVFQLLGESLVGQRKIHAAVVAYTSAVDQCKEHRGEFEMRLGTLLGEAGNSSRAIEHFERAASIEPSFSREAKVRIRGLQNNSCHF